MTLMAFKVIQSFSLSFKIINFLFASLITNFFKMLTETLLKILYSLIGRCSLVPTVHWLQRKYATINLSQAASSIILRRRRLPICIFSVKIAALGF
jgi:hypothetical protein